MPFFQHNLTTLWIVETLDDSPSSSPTSSDDSKISRPFKALPKNSLELAVAESFYTGDHTALAYAQYRHQCLSQMKHKADSSLKENMKRILRAKTDDSGYLEKRKRNNEAAKRSREARKAKQDELAIRVTFLEQEALTLKMQLAQSLREMDVLLGAYYL
ncbi:unnamed protein product [Ceutorhynchus assimilis]|uniref:BZIP domain-containing protein n=1 Tax=Ceutorhynchus assimilis TaxID=467358 RepID=A0A9P0DGG5_9CUCU|nr:unnamed protein product [Ceutorhynchus assimilis]